MGSEMCIRDSGIPVMPFVGDAFCRDTTPVFFPCLSVEADDRHLMRGVRVGDPENPLGLVLWFWQVGIDLSRIDGGEHKNLILPDDRR